MGSEGGRSCDVGVLASVTRGRPELLGRCLRSFARNAREAGRRPLLVVAEDGPPQPALDLAVRLRTESGLKVAVVGPAEKEALARALVREAGFPSDLVEFGLASGKGGRFAPGSNRNALMLLLAGRPFVSVDDDVVCSIARVPGADADGPVFTDDADPTEFWFFPDRGTLLRAGGESGADFLGLHEELLGRELAQGSVGVTQCGLRGDSGMNSPSWLLGREGGTRRRMTRSPADYQVARSSREVLRGTLRPTASAGKHFMTYAAGFDARRLLPPFLPLLRGEDEVFALVLRLACGQALLGHLPWTVLHAPEPPRAYEDGAIWRGVGSLRLKNVVSSCLVRLADGTDGDPERRLRALGRGLAEFASMPSGDFRDFLRGAFAGQAVRWQAKARALLERYGEEPVEWAADVRRAIELLRSADSLETGFLPSDLDGGLAATQGCVGSFGRLLESWPDWVRAAREGIAQGVLPGGSR